MTDAPRPNEFRAATLTSFSESGRLVERFEEILLSLGVQIRSGSDLESVCLDVHELEYYRLGQTRVDPLRDLRPFFGQAAGWIDFMRLIIRADELKRLDPFVDHLQLLNVAREVTQSTHLPVSDEASNKLFELFVALLCVQISNDVILDDPHNAQGDNPDIIAEINGRKWGFACKVINGRSPITLFERFEEGLRQIEVSPADTGFVFLNFKNIVDHRRAWPLLNEEEFQRGDEEPVFGAWRDDYPVLAQLAELLNERWQALVDVNGPQNLAELVQGRAVMPAAAVYMATATGIQSSQGPLPTLVGQLAQLQILPTPREGVRVVRQLNNVLHERRPRITLSRAVLIGAIALLLIIGTLLVIW